MPDATVALAGLLSVAVVVVVAAVVVGWVVLMAWLVTVATLGMEPLVAALLLILCSWITSKLAY